MSNLLKTFCYGIFALGVLTILAIPAQAQNGKHNGQKNIIMLNENPRFSGCEHTSYSISKKRKCAKEKLEEYIATNLQYPEEAKNTDFKPRVINVQITVEANGKINSPRVLAPGNRSYDKMAQMVFVKMVMDGINWVPGIYEGKGVKAPLTVPVHYTWEGRKNAFQKITDRSDVFEYVDEPPAFIPCQKAGIKDKEVRACVQETMAAFFKKNM